jgi:hypothetical protein
MRGVLDSYVAYNRVCWQTCKHGSEPFCSVNVQHFVTTLSCLRRTLPHGFGSGNGLLLYHHDFSVGIIN